MPSSPPDDPKRVAGQATGRPDPAALAIRILLATRNGAAFLPEQLASFTAQEHTAWSLLASDDGSTDATRALLARFAEETPARDVEIVEGPGRGSAANFLSALARSEADRPGLAVAFSDQDDVWLPEKLGSAADWLASRSDPDRPAGWVCRTVLTDPALRPTGESRRAARPTGFGNALVQNILAGNTIVLNAPAARAVAETVPAALRAGVPFHDWWVYQVLGGIGAEIGLEDRPLVLYRQHGANHLGHHGPLVGRFHRLGTVARQDYSRWLDANLAALSEVAGGFTPEARRMLRGFRRARRRGGPFLAAALPRLGLYRQTEQGDRMIRLMARAGRL